MKDYKKQNNELLQTLLPASGEVFVYVIFDSTGNNISDVVITANDYQHNNPVSVRNKEYKQLGNDKNIMETNHNMYTTTKYKDFDDLQRSIDVSIELLRDAKDFV